MKNFFKREHTDTYEEFYLPLMETKFNSSNIESMSKRKVISFFHIGKEKDFLAYRFDVLREWMKHNERYNSSFSERLNVVIDILSLQNELNSFEQQRIVDIEGIIFAKWRNLKQLIVDFNTLTGEFIFYRYEVDSFCEIQDNKENFGIVDSTLYITTKRLVFSKNIDTFTIEYKDIKRYVFSKDGFELELKNGKTYAFKCDNVYAVYVSLERVFRRENIIFN